MGCLLSKRRSKRTGGKASKRKKPKFTAKQKAEFRAAYAAAKEAKQE